MHRWPVSAEEKLIQFVKDRKSIPYLCDYFQKTEDAIRSKVQRLQKTGRIVLDWTDEEIQLLVECWVRSDPQIDLVLEYQLVSGLKNFPQRGNNEIAQKLSECSMQSLPWSKAEEAALIELAESDHLTLPTIYSRWIELCELHQWPFRTKIAIAHKIRRLDGILSLEEKGQYLTVPSLATALEVQDRIVRQWIEQGLLKINTRTQTKTQFIHYKAIVRFALDNPTVVAQRVSKMGVWWLMSLMQEYCAIRNRSC